MGDPSFTEVVIAGIGGTTFIADGVMLFTRVVWHGSTIVS